MSMYVIITTVVSPTPSVLSLTSRLRHPEDRLVIVGDKKGPVAYKVSYRGAEFLSLSHQQQMGFRTSVILPTGNYARKNIGYLFAMQGAADVIYETDDDNAPLECWGPRSGVVRAAAVNGCKWANVYQLFTREFVWPRGLPLDQIRNCCASPTAAAQTLHEVSAPIQQGLADNSPDVDAVWRLLHDKPVTFDRRPSICLQPGTWCPFNSQSTWWWPQAYPLMYLPSYCSFRMTDIWRSFVAQRCLWEMGYGVVFHAAEVYQDRNPHDLMRDFEAEIPGYRGNQAFVDVLRATSLKSGRGHALDNLVLCYERLIEAGFFPETEMQLVLAWARDIEPMMVSFENYS